MNTQTFYINWTLRKVKFTFFNLNINRFQNFFIHPLYCINRNYKLSVKSNFLPFFDIRLVFLCLLQTYFYQVLLLFLFVFFCSFKKNFNDFVLILAASPCYFHIILLLLLYHSLNDNIFCIFFQFFPFCS